MRNTLLAILLALPFISFSQLSLVELEDKPVPEPLSTEEVILRWNKSQVNYQKLPAESKEMLYWTNFCRANPRKFWDTVVVPVLAAFPDLDKSEARSLKTDLFATGPLPLFTLNSSLIETAQLHASDIGGHHGPLGHTSTDGTDFGTRMKRINIKRCAAENIAMSSHSTLLAVVLLYLDIGLPEKGHRKALLDPNLREIGIGSAKYGQGQYFLVQDMACAQ